MRPLIIAAALVASLGTARAATSWVCSDGVLQICASSQGCLPICAHDLALIVIDGAPVAPKESTVDLGTSRDTMKFHGSPSELSPSATRWSEAIGDEPPDPLIPRPARAYTLDEIDRMRKAVFSLLTKGTNVCLFVIQYDGNQYCKDPSDTFVEVRLHTYMLAGISPEALEAKAKEPK